MIDVFQYTDYRKYLSDYYQFKKSENSKFSHRYIASKMGFNSTGFFANIIKGRTNISGEVIKNFCDFLGLGKKGSEYFEYMVYFNQAKTHTGKSRYFEKMSGFKKSSIQVLNVKEYQFYEKWYYAALRELLYIVPFKGDNYQELARKFIPAITPGEAKKGLKLLERLGFIVENDQGFWVRSNNQSTSTGPHVKSVLVDNFQLTTMDLAKTALDFFPRKERNISSLTLTLSKQGFGLFEEEIRTFRKKLLNLAESDSSEDRVYQLNVQMFPVTKKMKTGEK